MYSYGYSYGSSYDSSGVLAAIAGMGIGMYVAIISLSVLLFVAWCKIIHKADRAWPLIFIPIYGNYLQYSIVDCGGIFWGSIALSFVVVLLTAFIESAGALVALWVIFGIVLLIMHIVYCKKLAEYFGKGAGFTIGLLLLQPIFILILGFGSAQFARGHGYTGKVANGSWTCTCGYINPATKGFCSGCGAHKNAL